MREVLANSIYSATQISKNNDDAWKMLQDYMEQVGKEEHILFDFKGVYLSEPWKNLEFRKFIKDARVHIRVYDNDEVIDSLKLLCMTLKTDENKVEKGAIKVVYTTKKVDKSELEFKERLKSNIVENENGVTLVLSKVVSQVGSYSTLDTIRTVVDEYYAKDENKEKKFVIYTGRMFIQDNILKAFAELVMDYTADGYYVDVVSGNSNSDKVIRTYICLDGALKIGEQAKIRLIKENVQPGTVGFLAKYKETHAKDKFGRIGNGVVAISRPAIYLGMTQTSDNTIVIKFREFNGNTFDTRVNYCNERNGEAELYELKSKTVTLEVDKIGFMSMFIGTHYHFNLPIQETEKGTRTLYVPSEDGGLTTKKFTIPEFCKEVLDDFRVPYNKKVLDESIAETRRILKLD